MLLNHFLDEHCTRPFLPRATANISHLFLKQCRDSPTLHPIESDNPPRIWIIITPCATTTRRPSFSLQTRAGAPGLDGKRTTESYPLVRSTSSTGRQTCGRARGLPRSRSISSVDARPPSLALSFVGLPCRFNPFHLYRHVAFPHPPIRDGEPPSTHKSHPNREIYGFTCPNFFGASSLSFISSFSGFETLIRSGSPICGAADHAGSTAHGFAHVSIRV